MLLSGLCDEDTIKQAVFLSKLLLTQESLEELYGNMDDDIIIEVTKERNLILPEELREEEETEDFSFEIQSAIDAADYALSCLKQALQSVYKGSNASFFDMMTNKFFSVWWKYSSLSDADMDIRQAQNALQSLNTELRILSSNKNVQLKYGRLASVINIWIDDGLLDALTHLQIDRTRRGIKRTITQVENIKRELRKLL